MSAWMPITTETSRGRFHARHRKRTLRSTLRRDTKRVETRSDSKRGLLPALKTRLAVSTTSFEVGAPPPSQTRNATLDRGPVTQAEAKLMQEAKEFAERTCASIDERRSFAESLLLEISHREADVNTRNKGKSQHYPVPAGSDVDVDASGMRGVGRQASSVSALDDKILAQVLADPTEWEDTLDINTLPSDEHKPRHRRSGSVRLMQTVSEELQVAKWRALAMFALNKGDAKCQDGRLYACRVDGCDSVRPTFRSLIYHLHMHDVCPDNQRSAPVREYCNACDTTFETRRDLIVHQCPIITDVFKRHAFEKTIHITSKGLLGRLTELANRISPITTKSQ